MNLILEVVKREGGAGPAVERKVFGIEGGRIGRAPDCDWVLNNPYISRHHATIRCINDTFYIESTGENGVAVNNAQASLPQLERRALKNGDRLFIDEYEISVALTGASAQAQPSAPTSLAEDFFFDAPSTPAPRATDPLSDPVEPPNEELDPLKKLMGGGSPMPTSPRHEASWNHSSSLADHFAPPPVVSPSALPIGEDWDQTSFDRTQLQPAESKGRGARGTSAPAGGGGYSPALPFPASGSVDSSQSSAPNNEAYAPAPLIPSTSSPSTTSAGAQSPFAPNSNAFQPAQSPTQTSAGAYPPAQQQGRASQTSYFSQPTPSAPASSPFAPLPSSDGPLQPTSSAARAPASSPQAQWAATPAPRQTSAGGRDSLDVSALLRNAGVDPDGVPPETLAIMGTILRTTVDGLIEMLRARAEFRNQFRLPVTRVRTSENNPLKFAINAEDALGSLLGRRNPGYMPPLEAFNDAFDDMRFHQIATLAGMRAGFAHVMNRFDPDRLQEQFDRHLKRAGFLPMATRFRYWELYVDLFEELAGDPDAAFHRMFGEEFASAYEKQLEALKRSRAKPQR